MRDKILTLLLEIEPDSDFVNSKDFFEDGLIDSFGVVSLITALEEQYSIQFEAGDISADNFMNLTCIIKLLEKYI